MSADPVSQPVPKLFLDTSALFAGIWSMEGGARMLLKLGEAGAVRLLVGPQVLAELDVVLRRKAPTSLPGLALLLERCRVEISRSPDAGQLEACLRLVAHPGDARVMAEALAAGCAFLVSLDQAHFLNNPALSGLPFRVGTPGDCLAWLRQAWR